MLGAQAVSGSRRRRAAARSKFVPVATRGLVTEENIALMTPGTARQLENWFPDADKVRVRKGFTSHCDTTETVPVNTLMAYHKQDGTEKLFAACNTTIYDVTSSSPSATTITALSNSKLQWVNFAATTNSYLFIVNGQDSAITFDGTTWANPSITGITSANITNVAIFKRRLFFTLVNSLQFAYLPVGNIAGAASTFDLGPEFSKGGYLMAIGVWTVDGGAGQDDHICFITSEGQVALYQGDDPSDPNRWAKVGTYNLPRPLGRRCVMQVGSDVYMITEAGILALRESLALDVAAVTAKAVTKNIQTAINTAATLYGTNYGWQLLSYPFAKWGLLNVPVTESEVQHQYVMNAETGAWCKFTGMNAASWVVLGNDIYFGGNAGVVYQANTGSSDNGTDIIAEYEGNYDYYDAPGQLKDFKMVQPIVYSDGSITPAIGINVDYEDVTPTTPITAPTVNVIKWGSFTWNSATWSDSKTLSRKFIPISSKPGYSGAIRMRAVVVGSNAPVDVEVNGFNVLFEIGSALG